MPQQQGSSIQPTEHVSGIRKYGEVKTKTPQVDWTVTDNGKGLLSGTLKYFYEVSTGNAIDQTYIQTLPIQGEVHPYDNRLICNDCTLTVGANDIGYCDANYIGTQSDPCDVEFKLSCPTEEDPIQVHPSFSLPADAQGSFGVVIEAGAAPKYQPVYDREMVVLGGKDLSEFDKFKVSPKTIEKDLVGVTSYKVARPTLSVSFVTQDGGFIATLISSVGMQTNAPQPKGNAPDWISGFSGRNWLLTSASVSPLLRSEAKVDILWRVELEYMLSGVGSDGVGKTWNKLIYKEAP